jgi:lantibiotic modifying enzyme
MLLNREAPPALVRLVERCLQRHPCERFASMAALEEALTEWEAEQAGSAPSSTCMAVEKSAEDRDAYRRFAARLGDTLCRMVRSEPDNGLSWRSTHENRDGFSARDLCIGSAGPVLALAGLVSELGEPGHSDVLRRAAGSLAKSRPSLGGFLPGLYVGEAGVGAALLLAGQVLGDPDLIASALDKGRLIASMPYLSPDLFNGTAGRLRFHLWLWHGTSDAEQLNYARHAGSQILKSAEDDADAGVCWTIPPGYSGLSGFSYIGYAHGAAGIADALLDLFEATADESFSDAARRAGYWIMRHAFETLGDSSGLDWPDVPGGASIGPFWCHGAAGVGQFFLHAAQLGVIEGAREFAVRAARSAARGARWSSPTQCHGLAGNIEFLLDMFQATSDAEYLHEAGLLGQLLQRFALESDGACVWPSESPDVISPDYMVGYAGVGACLLRLSDPERLPRQLSRSGFMHEFAVRKPLWYGSAGGSGARSS